MAFLAAPVVPDLLGDEPLSPKRSSNSRTKSRPPSELTARFLTDVGAIVQPLTQSSKGNVGLMQASLFEGSKMRTRQPVEGDYLNNSLVSTGAS
jgi:hypothetical protein